MTLTYYDNDKSYTPMKFVLPDDCKTFELSQMQNNMGFTMMLDEAEMDDMKDIKSPTFYVCRNVGLLRFNRHTFVKVNIPDRLKVMLHYCSDIEVLIGNGDSYNSIYPQIKRVLRFPEFLSFYENEHSNKPPWENDESLEARLRDGEEMLRNALEAEEQSEATKEKKEKKETDDTDLYLAEKYFKDIDDLAINDDDIESLDFAAMDLDEDYDIDEDDPDYSPNDLNGTINDPSHDFFYDWLRQYSGKLLYHYKDSENDFLMVFHQGHCYLVSFFDNHKDKDWLADEQTLTGFNAPFWTSESTTVTSPMHGIRKAARFLMRAVHVHATPVTILDDNVNIINLDDMLTEWDSLGLYICHKEENDDGLPPFDWLLDNVNPELPNHKNTIKEMRRALMAMRHFHIDQDY